MTLRALVVAAQARFVAAGIADHEAAMDAELLARHVLGWDRAAFLTRRLDAAPATFAHTYDALVARRERREPVAYIRAVQEFWGRDFLVSPVVLIPRPETELIVEEALLAFATRDGTVSVCDVGTGSGCLAVTLAAERPSWQVMATDISADALAVARTNAVRHAVDARVTFHHGSYFAGVNGPFDLIVANPPYIPEADYAALAPEVRDREPVLALTGGTDGLRDIRVIVGEAATRLAPHGVLLMEIGIGQAAAVDALVASTAGLTLLTIRADLQGIARMVRVGRL